MATASRAHAAPTAGRAAAILGLDTPAGAYLARLLLARGYRVAGTAVGPTTGLTTLGVADQVALYPDAASALQSTPAEVYDLRGSGPERIADTAALLALLARRPVKLFSAGAGPASDEGTALIEQARDSGMFGVTGRMFAHVSRLSDTTSPVMRIVAGVATGLTPDPGDITVIADYGWTAEYVDPMWRMLQRATAVDEVIATGRLLSGSDVARYAAEYFGRELELPPIAANEIKAVPGDAIAARQALGWSAATWGRDLVRLLCGGFADRETMRPG